MKIELSKDQKQILDSLMLWQGSKSPAMTLGGYAGTGKTTIIAKFRELIYKKDKKKRVAFASYTGKAARVLRDTLVENKSLYKKDTVGTIHSLIYSPVVSIREEIVGWERKEDIDYDLIIIDEASMVDQDIWKDLTSYQIPILAVGDHGQLPPIRGKFNLMENPILKLEKIHRQAESNPIIALSMLARTEGIIPYGKYSDTVQKIDRSDPDSSGEILEALENYNEDTLVLCGYNYTRQKLNLHIRGILEMETGFPEIGDRVICLKNNHEKDIFNGMHGTIKQIESEDEKWYFAKIAMDGNNSNFEGLIAKEQFNSQKAINHSDRRRDFTNGDLFDFGYALTVHKAQGSQAPKVILFEERFSKMDDDMWVRWLYTGVTRAETDLLIIGRS